MSVKNPKKFNSNNYNKLITIEINVYLFDFKLIFKIFYYY